MHRPVWIDLPFTQRLKYLTSCEMPFRLKRWWGIISLPHCYSLQASHYYTVTAFFPADSYGRYWNLRQWSSPGFSALQSFSHTALNPSVWQRDKTTKQGQNYSKEYWRLVGTSRPHVEQHLQGRPKSGCKKAHPADFWTSTTTKIPQPCWEPFQVFYLAITVSAFIVKYSFHNSGINHVLICVLCLSGYHHCTSRKHPSPSCLYSLITSLIHWYIAVKSLLKGVSFPGWICPVSSVPLYTFHAADLTISVTFHCTCSYMSIKGRPGAVLTKVKKKGRMDQYPGPEGYTITNHALDAVCPLLQGPTAD